MKRLCIYMTYNRENRIYEYMGQALHDLKLCCSKVYLVCNYQRAVSGLEYVEPYVEEIVHRNNEGYDSGAFKDMLCDFLGWGEVCKYDELVLVNDSFFGFFYPLEDTFELMDKEECDFWGMTGQEAGEFVAPDYAFDAHIHSYFMVFHKNVVRSEVFQQFWKRLEYPGNFREAVVNFEIRINACLKRDGFIGKSLMDVYHIKLKRNENPYYSMPYELVKDYKMPLMKKKCVLIRSIGFAGTIKTLNYLEKENKYDIERIKPYLENQFYTSGTGADSCNSLEIFYNTYQHIYIYGAGLCGQNLASYFAYKGWNYEGFIVTKPAEKERAVSIEKAEISQDTGIIISVLNAKVAEEITRHIGARCRKEQLFYISECNAIKLPD